MKVTGAEIKEFFSNYWPNHLSDWYYGDNEEDGIHVENDDGEFILDISKKYSTRSFAGLYWQGDYSKDKEKDEYMSFERAFKMFKETNIDEITIAIKMNKSFLSDFKIFAKNNNVSIVE